METNDRYQQKSIFSINLYNLWYISVLKTLNTHGGVILTLSFPDNVTFLEKLFFQLHPISLPTIQGEVHFKWKLLLSKTTGLSVNVIGRPQRRKCSAWVNFLQVTASHNVLTCKFSINQLLQRSASVIIKRGCCFELQSRASGIESKAVTTKCGNVLLQRGATLIKNGQKIKK